MIILMVKKRILAYAFFIIKDMALTLHMRVFTVTYIVLGQGRAELRRAPRQKFNPGPFPVVIKVYTHNVNTLK